MLFPPSLVGSSPKPAWRTARARVAARSPPRVRARELWRVDPAYLEQAQDDATLLAIRAQEHAGLDILTDGEERRESYSNPFAAPPGGGGNHNPPTPPHPPRPPHPGPPAARPHPPRHPVAGAAPH